MDDGYRWLSSLPLAVEVSTIKLGFDQEINSQAEFASFLVTLAQDLRTNRQAWAQVELVDFLDAMAYWTANGLGQFTMNMRGSEVPDPPTWRVFADILEAARVVEE